jgi:hypothetical protein
MGTLLQLLFSFTVGTVAHTRSLAAGFAIVGGIYLLACMAGSWPVKESTEETGSMAKVSTSLD